MSLLSMCDTKKSSRPTYAKSAHSLLNWRVNSEARLGSLLTTTFSLFSLTAEMVQLNEPFMTV